MDQVDEYCTKCSAAIPMPAVLASESFDLVSPSNLERLKKAGSPRALRGDVVVFDEKFTREDIEKTVRAGWYPYRHDDSQVYLNDERDFTTYRPALFKRDGDLVQIVSAL